MTDLATIIVSYNTRDLLAQSLRALRASLDGSELRTRTVVVDNQSRDGSAAMVERLFPWVELLRPGENLGFAGGNNLALRHLGFGKGGRGTAAAVWLLNPDTEVLADAPQRLLAHLGALFQAGAFAFPGLRQIVAALFPVPTRLRESRLNGRSPRRWWRRDRPFAVDMLLGAAMMVRGATIDEVGLLDEGYFMYAEELDWCRQIQAAGWQIHAVPDATVIHHSGQSTAQFRDRMFVALWRSRLRYYRKWESPRYVALVRGLLKLGMRWQQMTTRGDDPESARRRAAYAEVASL